MKHKAIMKLPIMKHLNGILIGTTFFMLSACAGTYKHTVNFDTSEPLRVAILPFAYVDKNGQVMELDANLAIDNIALVSKKLDEAPPTFVRQMVFSTLEKSRKDLIPPAVIDGALHHNGLSNKLVFDYTKLYALKPQDLGDLLDADAILYGKITKWDRAYYGLQTTNSVGIELRLVSARSGKDLFTATAQDSDNRGLIKGPTGWSSLALEPIKGLDNDIIVDLARRMVEEMLQPLAPKRKSETVVEPPPSILASSHDSVNGKISGKAHLTVLMLATPKKIASFSIGDRVENLPMLEKEEGHYIGEYYPLPSDKFNAEHISVSLVDQYGRQTVQKVGMPPVSVNQ